MYIKPRAARKYLGYQHGAGGSFSDEVPVQIRDDTAACAHYGNADAWQGLGVSIGDHFPAYAHTLLRECSG